VQSPPPRLAAAPGRAARMVLEDARGGAGGFEGGGLRGGSGFRGGGAAARDGAACDEWLPVLHPGLQKLFYYHRRLGKSVWTRPDGNEEGSSDSSDRSDRSKGELQAHKELAEAPDEGWEAHFHEHWKRPYYFNRHSRKSTWTDPQTAALLKGLEAAPATTQQQAPQQQPQAPQPPRQGACYGDVLEAGSDEAANNEAAAAARLQFPELGEVRITQLGGPLAALNGMRGTVVLVSKSGRVDVRLAGKVLLLRAANLELVAFNPFATPRHARLGSSGSVLSSMAEVSVGLSLDDPDAGRRSDAAAAPPSRPRPLSLACDDADEAAIALSPLPPDTL
jgi:hypothetical protein